MADGLLQLGHRVGKDGTLTGAPEGPTTLDTSFSIMCLNASKIAGLRNHPVFL